MSSRAVCIGMVAALTFATACGREPGVDYDKKKSSIEEAEAELVKMFSDSSGRAEFSCTAGGSRYDYICDGRYIPTTLGEQAIAHRIGANLSHYFEGKPVFAISVIRDTAKK